MIQRLPIDLLAIELRKLFAVEFDLYLSNLLDAWIVKLALKQRKGARQCLPGLFLYSGALSWE
jgi:hypothetical protein